MKEREKKEGKRRKRKEISTLRGRGSFRLWFRVFNNPVNKFVLPTWNSIVYSLRVRKDIFPKREKEAREQEKKEDEENLWVRNNNGRSIILMVQEFEIFFF